MLEQFAESIALVFDIQNFLWALFGVAFGMVMGAIPGLSDTIAIALLLPFTYYLGPIPGIAMLMGLSKGANFGGSIPAILFNIPGTPQAMITTFDGYPLTRQGKSGKALQTALISSVLADVASDLVLIFLAAPVAALALMIGPPEYAMIILFSLVIISLAAAKNPLKGFISAGIGLFLSTVGCDPETGAPRFTFGFVELSDGISIMPLAIGLLALSEVFIQLEKWLAEKNTGVISFSAQPVSANKSDNYLTFREFRTCLPVIGRSTIIGSLVGIAPGIGTTVGAYLSYIWSRKKSGHPELFGKGAIEGVAASEAGNNAVNGPNLVPLVTLGIPGNLAAALILGGFMIKGLTPGPQFMQSNGPLLYALFLVLFLSNIYTFAVGEIFISFARKLTGISRPVLFACVPVFCVIGAYINNASMFDVGLMFIFGIFGYLAVKCNLVLPVLIVGFFLGSILEHKMRQALTISRGDWSIFITRPVSCIFLCLTAAVIAYYIYKNFWRKKFSENTTGE